MKPFTRVAVFIFMIVASLHILRLFFEWRVLINEAEVPLWVSIVGALIAGGLAFAVWWEASHGKH